MPFTLSHPALVLPLFRLKQSRGWKTSLVMGSMAPDFWALAPSLLERQDTHGRWGLLIAPPMALAGAWLFQFLFLNRIVRMPGITPQDVHRPFGWASAALAAFLGTATHLLWDQLTHEGSRIQSRPFFDRELVRLGSERITTGGAVWIGCSALGALVLWAWALVRLRRAGHSWRILLDRNWVMVYLAFLAPLAAYATWLGLPSISGEGGLGRIFHRPEEARYVVLAMSLAASAMAWWAGRRNGSPGGAD